MSDVEEFANLGVIPSNEGAANSIANSTISEYQEQNLSANSILEIANGIATTVGGIPGIGSSIPGLGKIGIPGLDKIGQAVGTLSQFRIGTGGEWESLHYAGDLNAHHPKFKFLFKVKFVGFNPPDTPTSYFHYYVHRIDKPKVRLQHADVNYYNFRTRVLTHVSYDPLSVTFLDEIGNSVNQFFVEYMKGKSGQANGNYGINHGNGEASSSLPYDTPKSKPQKGYSDGKEIIVEQIFANGSVSNRFIFINPRIESFDFDELNMDDNAGSALTCTFTYDAIRCETNETGQRASSLIHTWGKTDLLAAGGTSGPENGGQSSSNERLQGSASGLGVATGDSPLSKNPQLAFQNAQLGTEMGAFLPPSLSDLSNPAKFFPNYKKLLGGADASQDTLNKSFSESYLSMCSGDNLKFSGSDVPFSSKYI